MEFLSENLKKAKESTQKIDEKNCEGYYTKEYNANDNRMNKFFN